MTHQKRMNYDIKLNQMNLLKIFMSHKGVII